MTLFFTPVRGKDAFLYNWPTTQLTEQQARKIPEATGIAVVHGPSGTVAFDLDDVIRCNKKFEKIGIDIQAVLKGHFNIVSPKDNRQKVIFEAPQGVDLDYVSLPAGSKRPMLELRCGNRYDLWHGSKHPEGGMFKHGGSKKIKPLPKELLDFWLQCIEFRANEQKATSGNGEIPLMISADKLSIIHLFNVQHPLETILVECGYKQKGNKWQGPNSQSGAYGLTIQQSYLNPWDVCYSHHASDGDLSGRPIDAFEIAASFSFEDKDINTAKRMFTAQQAKVLKAIDPDTGELLEVTADQFNNPQPISNLSDLITDNPTFKSKTPPTFKEEIISELPMPLPLLLHNFKECIYEPVPAMFGPAFMAIHETLLQAKVRTIRDRSVNCNYANGSLSGGGKDDNSVEATYRYYRKFDDVTRNDTGMGKLTCSALLVPITTTFTSGTNLLQTLHSTKITEACLRPAGGVMMSAEATSFYRTLADTNNHYSGNAIIDVEIACFNGQIVSAAKITSNTKNHMEDIREPNFSFFRLTQLDPFKRAFSVELVEKGYYGRLFETYDVRENVEYVTSATTNKKVFNFNDEGFRFLLYMSCQLELLKQPIQVKCNEPGGIINKWEEEVIGNQIYPKMDKGLFPGIKRVAQIGEKWVAMITAYNYFWLNFKEEDTAHLVLERNSAGDVITLDGTNFEGAVVPMMDYLASVKWFTIYNYVITSDAAELDSILEELWSDCVTASQPETHKPKTFSSWLKLGLVPYQMFSNKIKNKREVQRIIVGDTEKIDRTIKVWLQNKGLKVSSAAMVGAHGTKKKTCIVEKTSGL